MGRLFANLRYDVCCVLHRVAYCKSCVSCQALAEALKQNSTLTDLNLMSNNIGPEGAKAWCLVRMGSWGELCQLLVWPDMCKIFKNQVQGLPQEVPGKSRKSWGHSFSQAVSCPSRVSLAAWNQDLKMARTTRRCSHVCGIMCAVCFIMFLKSCVYCQALAEGLKENSTLTELNLEYNYNIGPEGAKAWCLVRMGSWEEKHSELISRCIHPVEICDDKCLRYLFWCIWHVLARSWSNRETIHNSSISKTGHPVIFKF